MSFPVIKVTTVQFVLRGEGHLQAVDTAPLPSSHRVSWFVPAPISHWIGEPSESAATGAAADKCELIGGGRVEFTAGNGDDDTLLL